MSTCSAFTVLGPHQVALDLWTPDSNVTLGNTWLRAGATPQHLSLQRNTVLPKPRCAESRPTKVLGKQDPNILLHQAKSQKVALVPRRPMTSPSQGSACDWGLAVAWWARKGSDKPAPRSQSGAPWAGSGRGGMSQVEATHRALRWKGASRRAGGPCAWMPWAGRAGGRRGVHSRQADSVQQQQKPWTGDAVPPPGCDQPGGSPWVRAAPLGPCRWV